MIGDFHIHTKYSYDSLNDPKKVVKIAKKRGLDTIAVTDHDCIRGAILTKRYEDDEITVIPGIERKTDAGDIIGLNVTESIKSIHWRDVIDEIHSLGGIAVLPHPYRGHKDILELAKNVDLIEIWNSRSNSYDNMRALELAETLKKGVIAGSDAHTYSEIGNAAIFIEYLGAREFRFLSKKLAKRTEKVFSYLVGDIKRRKFNLIPYHLSLLVRKI